MNNKENEPSKKNEKETFLKICNNVKRCKGMDWEEKVILSNHISFQTHGKEFYQTDSYQAKELGLSTAQISKYTSRLKERGEINTEMKYEVNPTGGRPIPVRYVTVIDMDKWTKGDATPLVKKIISSAKKRLAMKMAEFTSNKNEVVSNPDTTIDLANNISPAQEPEAKPLIKTVKVKKDNSLVEMLEEVDAKGAEATTSTQIKSNDAKDVIILDSEKDIDNSNTIAQIIIAKIKKKENVEFKNVRIKFDNDIVEDEAILLPNGKYFSKSLIRLMDASVFE